MDWLTQTFAQYSIARFFLAAVEHPHIIEVYQLGRKGKIPYIATRSVPQACQGDGCYARSG